jgi:predicted amidohydrolase
MEGEAVQWIKSKSRAMGADIAGSIIIVENGCYFNRLVWAKPDGRMYTYDKKHLFRMAGEDRAYTPGDKNITVELEGWSIRPFICYDLRFPLWTRNFDNSYDAAVFIANWPAKRSHHWKSLILARAIENQSYVAAVNRTGADGKGNDYCGDSAIIDPLGEIIFQGGRDECVHTSSLSYDLLADCRLNFPVWKDADGDRVK